MRLFWRLLRRDFHSRAWRTLFYAVTVAIAALTAVGLLASRMERLLTVEANTLLAADAVIVADHPVPAALRGSATQRGLLLGQLTTFPSMVRKGEATTLVSVKAASESYPLRGQLKLLPDSRVGKVPKPGEVMVDARLAALLDAQPGDAVQLGNSQLRIAARRGEHVTAC